MSVEVRIRHSFGAFTLDADFAVKCSPAPGEPLPIIQLVGEEGGGPEDIARAACARLGLDMRIARASDFQGRGDDLLRA